MSNYTPESDTRTAPEHYHVLGATLSITADAETTDGEYLVLDMLVPPTFENGLHTHEQSEVFHVIEGEARLHVEGRDRTLGPGTSGYVPGGAVHGFANEEREVCRVIAVMTRSERKPTSLGAGVSDSIARQSTRYDSSGCSTASNPASIISR
jgi:mannose-6-phosphate isomerase-like protein (cupin superfamily)